MARLLLKRKTSGTTVPAASDLLLGELAINTVTGKIFLRDGDNVVTDIKSTIYETTYDTGNSYFKFNNLRPTFVKLIRGESYLFRQTDATNASHPILIKTGTTGAATEYTTGVTKTVISSVQKALKFDVPLDSPDTLHIWGATAAEGLSLRIASDSDQILNTNSTPTFSTIDVGQLKINGVIVDLDNIVSNYDFWSSTQATTGITAATASIAVTPTVTLPVLGGTNIIPADATISNVTLLLKWRLTTNTNTENANNLAVGMNLQYKKAGGTYATIHTFPSTAYFTPANTSSSGEIISADLGLDATALTTLTTDLASAAVVYQIQLSDARASYGNLTLRDLSWGLRVYWR